MKPFLKVLAWVPPVVAAIILLQTLWFKFTGDPSSKYIFTQLHAEPWGRIGSGVVELIASVLIIIPSTRWIGAILAMGVMAGAILAHLFILGISVQNDRGELFGLAVAVFVMASITLWMNRSAIPFHLLKSLVK